MRRKFFMAAIGLSLAFGGITWQAQAQTNTANKVQTATFAQSSVADWQAGTLEGLLVTNNSDGELRLDQAATQGTFTSVAHEVPFVWNAVSAHWNFELPVGTSLSLKLRTSANGTEWREWQTLNVAQILAEGEQLLGPIGVETDSRWLQYQVDFASSNQPAAPSLQAIAWRFIDTSNGPKLTDQLNRAPAAFGGTTFTRPPQVISRNSWGALPGIPNLLPSRPRRIELVSLPLNNQADPPTMLRALQAAAQAEGAADLPYQFVIDQAGNVYAGRNGFPASNGTIRLALLGDLTDAARTGLGQIIAWISEAYRLPQTLTVLGSLNVEQAESIRRTADQLTVRKRLTFVESNTRDYNERIMLFNPTNQIARTIVTFLPGQTNAVRREYEIQPGQRVNIIANEIFSDTFNLPIEVSSNQAIVGDRTMLFANDALGESGISRWSRTWYFAEGDGSNDRSTLLWLYNPQPSEVVANLLMMPTDGITTTRQVLLPPFTRTQVDLSSNYPKAFGLRIAATAPIAAERTILVGPTKGGGFLTHGAVAPSNTWYFAEGATLDPFVTTLALLNPNPVSAAITTTFMTEEGSTFTRRYQVPALARLDVDLREIVPSPQGVGTMLTASQPIVAERTSYFNGGNSATNSLGAAEPDYVWHFAEGRTADPATEFLLVLNPNQRPAQVKVTLGKDDGTTQVVEYTIPRTGRISILLDAIDPNLQSHTISVEANLPVVAERTILIDNTSGGGGHSALGTPER
ncbi:hypothetical protein [Herpetosiphon gulosus]|uniref:Peptidoglycan recognition protein family domain-containing protein n=1 Tax=Herpetosiphon gulosus TaxID=1973496 RepID=A0ABP9WZ44_9CHLR